MANLAPIATREHLGLTQAEMAQLMDVHPMTVSKWERQQLVPSPWQQALQGHFLSARQFQPGELAAVMAQHGPIEALYVVLHSARDRVERDREWHLLPR